jgi:hypothetical protein
MSEFMDRQLTCFWLIGRIQKRTGRLGKPLEVVGGLQQDILLYES